MADESPQKQKGAYDLEPESDSDAQSEAATDSSPTDQPPASGEPMPSDKLLDAFDDDEDLESDPEVEQALHGKKKTHKEKKSKADQSKAFVKGGWDPPKALAIAGGVLSLSAIIATFVNAQSQAWLNAVLSLYKIALHTGTGIVAVVVSALLLQMKIGPLDKAAARMFVAVSAFMLVAHLNINIPTRTDEIALGSLAYLVMIMWLFRFKRDQLQVVAIAHLALVAILQLGLFLAKLAAQNAAAAADAAGAAG